MRVSVKATGVDGIVRAFAEAPRFAEEELRDVRGDAATLVAATARTLVPSRSGRARGSIGVERDKESATVVGTAAYFGRLDFGDEPWRPFIRNGRYLYPAMDRRRAQVDDRLEQGAEDVLAKMGMR